MRPQFVNERGGRKRAAATAASNADDVEMETREPARRRRRRNPSEKAAAAARMAAGEFDPWLAVSESDSPSANLSPRFRIFRDVSSLSFSLRANTNETEAAAAARERSATARRSPRTSRPPLPDDRPLGSCDDEEIPAARRAHMASAAALRAAADGDLSGLGPRCASEVEFDVLDPPMEPVEPPGDGAAACGGPGEMGENDVLCGRGGGTNSQMGNRRFRAREF